MVGVKVYGTVRWESGNGTVLWAPLQALHAVNASYAVLGAVLEERLLFTESLLCMCSDGVGQFSATAELFASLKSSSKLAS